jgi:hypothetical protein
MADSKARDGGAAVLGAESNDGDPASLRGERRSLRSREVAVVGVFFVAAAVLRLIAITKAYDIFIDEVSYTQIASNITHGKGLFLNGSPFMLHPPLAFDFFSLAMRVFQMHGTTDAVLFQLRPVVACVGAATCAVAYLLVRQASDRPLPAILTATIIAVDPFVIRFDSRVMLEAPAQLAATATFALLAWSLHPPSRRARRIILGAAGIAGAVTMATKETFGLVLLLSLVAMIASGWIIERRAIARVTAIAVAGYGLIVATIGLPGGWREWVSTKTYGLSRLIGTRQDTGFNAASTHVSLVSRLVADMSQFAATYVLLLCGGFAVLALLWHSRPWRFSWDDAGPRERTELIIVLWGFAASAYLGYAIVFGSIEEQMFYILAVPLFASMFLWAARALPLAKRQWRVTLVMLLTLALVFDAGVWFVVHRNPDDEYRRFLRWERTEVPAGSVVAVTEYTAQFLLHGVVIGQWSTLDAIRAHRVDYVVMVTSLTTQGYGLATPEFQSQLEHGGRLVFQAKGRAEGSFRVYDVRQLTGGSGA